MVYRSGIDVSYGNGQHPEERTHMAKGQQRKTREKKKPKQAKLKPAAPASRFAAAPVAAGDPAAGKKKW
jgi:hypothetical protein